MWGNLHNIINHKSYQRWDLLEGHLHHLQKCPYIIFYFVLFILSFLTIFILFICCHLQHRFSLPCKFFFTNIASESLVTTFWPLLWPPCSLENIHHFSHQLSCIQLLLPPLLLLIASFLPPCQFFFYFSNFTRSLALSQLIFCQILDYSNFFLLFFFLPSNLLMYLFFLNLSFFFIFLFILFN